MTAQEKIDFIKKNLPVAAQVNPQRAAYSGKFDPRPVFTNASVNALFADARTDFSDGRSNGATDGDDDTSEHSNLGMAADLINCEISGESGPGCGHNGVDHVGRAIDCLTNYAKEEAARKQRLASVGQQHSVRFA